MRNQLLLLEDVDDLGRSGDIISVKPGFARNFLLPQKKAVVADKFTLRMQARLKEERAKRAEIDRSESLELSDKIQHMVLSVGVKVDPDGNMYGSVGISDILSLFKEQGIVLERRNIALVHPIKTLGVHTLNIKLKEGIPTSCTLKIFNEAAPNQEIVEEYQEEEPTT